MQSKVDQKPRLDTMSISGDSGYSAATTPDPFAAAAAAELDLLPQDFRNEKVADTKSRLRDLMSSLSGASDKSLLLQTTALFETLLNKIHNLQGENERLKATDGEVGDIVLELEASRYGWECFLEIGLEKIIPMMVFYH